MTNTESTERFVAANLCTEKVYGFIPDYWALVDTECHNKRRAHGKREEMQFLADGLNAHHKAERSSDGNRFYVKNCCVIDRELEVPPIQMGLPKDAAKLELILNTYAPATSSDSKLIYSYCSKCDTSKLDERTFICNTCATSSERVSISRRCAENSLQRAEHDTDPSYDKLIVLAAEKDRKELKAALEKDNE